VGETPAYRFLTGRSTRGHDDLVADKSARLCDRLRWNHDDDGIAIRLDQDVERPRDEWTTSEFLKLFERRAARSLASPARRDDGRGRSR
jgi:hypothetical protein